MAELEYKPLKLARLQAGAVYPQFTQFSPRPVNVDSPAVEVMTDLRLVAAATIDADTRIEAANHAMIARGVRSLLVVDADGCVLGLLTARDLLGERPMQVVRDRGGRHEDLVVRDIMTPQSAVEVVDIRDVLRARVGHVVETLKHSGRQHALVVESDLVSGRELVRGIFSASQIARQLGVAIHPEEVARTFAEIEAVLSRTAAAI